MTLVMLKPIQTISAANASHSSLGLEQPVALRLDFLPSQHAVETRKGLDEVTQDQLGRRLASVAPMRLVGRLR